MASDNQSGNRNLCPHCQAPLSHGVKFCESCGAKAEAPASCPHCGDPLTPGVKFCESCGKAVPAAPAPAPVAATVPGIVPEPEPVTLQEEPAKAATTAPVSPEPAPAEPGLEPVPAPEAESVPEPAEVPASPSEKKDPTVSKLPPATTPGASQKTLIVAGLIGLVVIAALAWFVVLPMLAGAGPAASGNGAGPAGTVPSPSDAAVSSPQTTSPVSFDPQPVQRLPVSLEVTYQVERDPRNGIVTVTFRGGPGFNGIATTLIRVTRSDGQVAEKSWKPSRIGDAATVQGTTLTDRVEVITTFYNGDSYRVYDDIFEYKQRN